MRHRFGNRSPLQRRLSVFIAGAVTMGLGWSGVVFGEIRVGLVLDRGGKDDKSFNASAFAGATRAQNELKISLKTVEASDDNSYEPLLRSFAQKKFDLIIGIGIAQAEAMKKIAAQFPDRKFAIVDSQVDVPNVRSLLFEEHEGSFLVGAIAAMTSKSGKVGFIGGMDVPLIRRFELGFFEGAKYVNKQVKTVANYVGVTTEAWNNPPKAKELAILQYDGGADVIFAAAGASGAGLFDAAEEKSKKKSSPHFAIGVDSNQNWIRPGLVLTSMLKRVDLAVLSTCQDFVAGKFTGGVVRYGLKNSGIDYARDEHNAKVLSPAVIERVEKIKADIVSGQVKVPDFYQQKAKK